MGSALVDEEQEYRHRIKDAVAGTEIGEEQFYQTMISYYRQKNWGSRPFG